MWYDVDLIKLSEMLLPPTLRKKKFFAFLQVMIYPFKLLLEKLISFQKDATLILTVSGQVISLERVLNELFYSGKDIYLTDVPLEDFYLYNDDETGKGLIMYNDAEVGETVWRNDGEGRFNGDFIVNVPFYLKTEEQKIRNILDRYKVTGRKYIIKYYEYE